MKLLWNSLLISLGILLPVSTSAVLAESLKTAESIELTPSAEQILPVSDSAVAERELNISLGGEGISPVSNFKVEAIEHELKPLHGQIRTGFAESVAVEEREPVSNPKTIVIPEITQESLRELIISDDSPETSETIVIPDTAPSTFTTEDTESGENTTAPTAEESTEETEASENAETPPEGGTEESVDAQTPELSPEELERQQRLIEADRLYMSGQFAAAQQLYREAKAPFEVDEQVREQPVAIYDSAELSPAGAVYWRQAQAGLEQQLETKILVPLQFLVEQQPEFIPAHLNYAQALKDYGREEEALQVLERASTLYPNEPELLKARITALGEAKRWLEASLAARQFALLNFNHPQAEEFEALAEENLERHKSHLRSELRGNAIANVITGALGYIFTGNLFGPISAVETTVLMLRGESAVGEGIAKQVQRQLPMVEDEEVLEYVREIGNKLAIVTGRDEFEYEFYVIMDDRLNAFALPGGKIFVNAGAILKTNSEAELAGLLAHELAHAVLSHGFQLVTEGNLIANITQYIPFGGTATNLIVLDYSRNMERQADDLGTRILVAGGYAADGLHNLMVTLAKEERERPLFAWLSTHPDTEERISNLETLIERNGYNRYTYEGVARHLVIQERVAKLLKEYEERQECEEEEREDCEETPAENEENESELSN